jgi:hypothetical protein
MFNPRAKSWFPTEAGTPSIVGMNGGRTLMAGIHGLHHIHDLGAPDLADDDPVGRIRKRSSPDPVGTSLPS